MKTPCPHIHLGGGIEWGEQNENNGISLGGESVFWFDSIVEKSEVLLRYDKLKDLTFRKRHTKRSQIDRSYLYSNQHFLAAGPLDSIKHNLVFMCHTSYNLRV